MAAAACLISSASLRAQDRIILQRPDALTRMKFTGLIEEYTGREITIRSLQGDAVKKYPAAEVVEVRTQESESHARGLKLLADNQVAPAAKQFEAALKEDERAWVRRDLLALLVRCAMRQGDYATAGSRFSKLYESDPSTFHFKQIPLKWSPGQIGEEARVQAQSWLVRGSEVERLIAASLLLDEAASSKPARITIKELSASSDPRIKLLGQAQGLRVQIAGGGLADLQVQLWRDRIDGMPQELRAGPSYLLGRAYTARRDYELAAAAFLWLPLVDDDDYNLAARACLEAGESLAAIGQQAEAESLYAEVSRRYSDSVFAGEALALLKRGGALGDRKDDALPQ